MNVDIKLILWLLIFVFAIIAAYCLAAPDSVLGIHHWFTWLVFAVPTWALDRLLDLLATRKRPA